VFDLKTKKSFIIALSVTLGIFLLFSSMLLNLTSFLHPIVLLVVFCCIFFFVYFSILYLKNETICLPFALFMGILILYTIALLILLFQRPNNQSYNSWNLIPFSTISFYLSGKINWLIAFYNLAANIGLFIPYGIFLMLKKSKSLVILVIIPLVSIVLIEVMQLFTQRGILDIDDLILNMLGVFLGYMIYPAFKRIVTIEKGA
jgi:glycopeptide antibiotics resistance protein